MQFHVILELTLGAGLIPVRVESLLEPKVTQIVAKVRLAHRILQPNTKQLFFPSAKGLNAVTGLAVEAGDRHVDLFGGGLESDA